MSLFKRLTLVVLVAIFNLALGQTTWADGPRPEATSACSWTVRGRLRLDPELTKLSAEFGQVALKNVLIKVSTTRRVAGVWAPWNNIGETRTNTTGAFAVGESMSCDARRVKVEATFESTALKVEPKREYTVHLDETQTRQPGTIDLGDMVFRASGVHDLNDFEARRHAEIWFLYVLVRDTLAGLGHPFTDQVQVRYPNDDVVVPDSLEASYASPITHQIHIHKGAYYDDFGVNTLIHELMHVWAYQHWDGGTGLVSDWLKRRTTHGIASNKSSAFHEGFAEFANEELQVILFDEDRELPFTRVHLAQNLDLTTSNVELHDVAWLGALRALTTPELFKYTYLFGTSQSDETFIQEITTFVPPCQDIAVSLAQVLNAMRQPSLFTKDNITMQALYNRVAATTAQVQQPHADMYRALMNPYGTLQPAQTLCTAPFSLSLDNSTLTMVPGSNRALTVHIVRDLGFTGPVALELSSPNANIAADFSPASTSGLSSALTLNVGASVPFGTYQLTVRGTGAGKTDTVAVTLTIKRFTLSLSSDYVALGAGLPATSVTVSISRMAGFSTSLTLTLEDKPTEAGVGHSFAPATTTGNTSSLSLSASRFAPSNAYLFTVRATDPTTGETVTEKMAVEVINPNALP